MAATKGCLHYERGYSFLLHVFWEAPSMEAAAELLAGLNKCAIATHRDTPIVPTYFFRITTHDNELCQKSLTVGEHPQLMAAKKKLLRGVPPHAVQAELVKRRIDPALVDADPAQPLPIEQQLHPVTLEFTEIYLDERAFMEHAGSRDYLDGYGIVMNPAMHNRTPQTIRLGTPSDNLIEKILEPILHENVVHLPEDCFIWRKPDIIPSDDCGSVFLSLDFSSNISSIDESSDMIVASVSSRIPASFKAECTSCVSFLHALRERTVRVMCVLPQLPSTAALSELVAVLQPVRGEAHITVNKTSDYTDATDDRGPDAVRSLVEQLQSMLLQVGLGDTIAVNKSAYSGYALHTKASQLNCIDDL